VSRVVEEVRAASLLRPWGRGASLRGAPEPPWSAPGLQL